jgi:SprT-like family
MKLRWKIVITILLAVLAVWLQGVLDKRTEHFENMPGGKSGGSENHPHGGGGTGEEKAGPQAQLGPKDVPTVSDLLGFFEEYNEAFFNKKLPENTIVDWDEHGEVMARTKLVGGQYHIALNQKYSAANRFARLMVLHEMCHIKNFDEEDPKTENHGPRWRTCMLKIEIQGGNRAILIDGYTGQ